MSQPGFEARRADLEALLSSWSMFTDAERTDLVDALSPVPDTVCMRGIFAMPLAGLLGAYGDAVVEAFEAHCRALAPIRGPFSWLPLRDFLLMWLGAARLACPDAPDLSAAVSRLIVTHILELQHIPAIRTLKAAADGDLCTFLRQGFQSVSLFQNFSVVDVEAWGHDWLVAHVQESWWPAMEVITRGYNAGIFALFGVDGEQIYTDAHLRGWTVRLSWSG